MAYSVIKRFIKGFVASGLASAALQLQAGVVIHSLADLKQFGFSLVLAFITGAVLAGEKALSWTPEPQG